jgi:hypothetical protein
MIRLALQEESQSMYQRDTLRTLCYCVNTTHLTPQLIITIIIIIIITTTIITITITTITI